MGSARIKDYQLLVDERPFYLCGGEIHYFRLPIEAWKPRLEEAKRGGINTISTYMPWYWHERQEGHVFLFGEEKPETNLAHFLDLAIDLDLKVIARPGPFINSELRLGGFPQWLFEKYPNTLSRKSDGKIVTGRPIPAEGEPEYRNFVKKWYQSIIPLLSKYDIHNGGPIILFQPDNELSAAWSFGLLNSLYDNAIINIYWPRWLEERYSSIDYLNEIIGQDYSLFIEVAPPRRFPKTQAERVIAVEWLDFKRWFFADWGVTLAKWAIELGIQVPIIFNEPVAGYYGHGDHAGFGSVMKQNGILGTTACHTYSRSIMDLDGSISAIIGMKLLQSSPWRGPAYSIEANASWNIPRLTRSDINWPSLLRLGFANGLSGTVIYPYAAGAAAREDTIDGTEYWETTCIGINGNTNEGYRQVKRYFKFIQAWQQEFFTSQNMSDITIAYTPGQRILDFVGAPKNSNKENQKSVPGGERFDAEPALDREGGSAGHDWLDGYEGVSRQTISPEAGIWKRVTEAAILFSRLNYSFDMLELTHPNREPGQGCLLVACTGSLETTAIDYLIEHLDKGGKCIFFPTIPVCNLNGETDTRIAEKLGVNLVECIRPAGGEIMDYGMRYLSFGDNEQAGVDGWIFNHKLPKASNVFARYSDKPVIATCSGDNVMISGTNLAFTSFDSLKLWQGAFASISIKPEIKVNEGYYYAITRKGEQGSFLTVVNITGRVGKCMINIESADTLEFTIDLKPHEARILVLNVPVKDNRICYTTSEVTPLNEERSKMALYGEVGTPGEIAFVAPSVIKLNGITTQSKKCGKYYVINYTHKSKPIILTIT